MRKTASLIVLLMAFAGPPALASGSMSGHGKPMHVTCDMVRAYVGRVGIAKAKAVAQQHGITPQQKRQARRCLANSA